MRFRPVDLAPLAGKCWCSRFEFPPQVPPLVLQLPSSLANLLCAAPPGNLANVELVTTPLGLGRYLVEKRPNRGHRFGRRTESQELRMIPVTSRRSSKDLLCQQPFSPARNQPLRIQIPRMNCPQAHGIASERPPGRCFRSISAKTAPVTRQILRHGNWWSNTAKRLECGVFSPPSHPPSQRFSVSTSTLE